jgi:anti-sigma regulatory factor (Ser/Thr protein kinase)
MMGLQMECYVPWTYAVELPVHVRSVSQARHFVVERLDQHDLSYLVDDVQLVVSELATNALVHARTPFTVSLEALESSVLLMVEDGSTCGPSQGDPEVGAVGGRGLMIVQILSRDWGVSVDSGSGKSVWAVFDTR